MTSAVAVDTRPASLSLVDTPITTCRNTGCNLELTSVEKARVVRLNGLCTECHDDGVIVPALVLPAPAQAAEEATEDTAARLTSLGLDTETGDVRRCGHCDANISTLPTTAAFCGTECKHQAAAETAAQTTPAPRKAAKAPRNRAMEVATEIVLFGYDISEYEAETGLTSAVAHWSNGRVAGQGIEAAARVWSGSDEEGESRYDLMTWAERGRANRKALPILKAAIKAAQEYRTANPTG